MTLAEDIYERHRFYYDLGEALREFSEALMNAQILPPPKSSENAALALFVVRAHTTFCAGIRLCRNGFAPAAILQTRTLVEELITLRYILSNQGMAERWAEYTHVERYLHLCSVLKLGDFFQDLRTQWQQEAEAIETEYKAVAQKYSSDFNKFKWAGKGKSIRKLAYDSSTGSAELYDYYYGQFSQVVHGTVNTAEFYMKVENETDATFFPGATDFLQPQIVKFLVTLFPLFWDEVSIQTGNPHWGALREVSKNDYFEHFARNPAKKNA